MRLSRFFIDEPLAIGSCILPLDQAHYVQKVLRLNVGDSLQLFDGSGLEYRGAIIATHKNQVTVELQEVIQGIAESALSIHLGQGLSRGERMDWVIQKATELGAKTLTPILSNRCEVRLDDARSEKRLKHWRHIALSACEQSGRSVPLVIHPPMPLSAWLNTVAADLKWVLDTKVMSSAQTSVPKPATLAVLIGPEGGLTEQEVQQAHTSGFQSTQLGPRILRTETAPLAAVAVAQYLWGDLK